MGGFLCEYRSVLSAWNAVVVEELRRKEAIADDMHRYLVVNRYFADWKKVSSLILL